MEEAVVPSDEQTSAAFSGPAVAISYFTIHPAGANLIRLSFMETHPDGSNPGFRCAVILDGIGTRNLGELLLKFAPPKADVDG